jgi:hypothetical protein
MIESDAGIFDPLSGIRFDGSGLAKAYMEEIMELLEPINATGVKEGAEHPDLGMWDDEIPKGSLDIDRSTYFWYHHTHGRYIINHCKASCCETFIILSQNILPFL